MASEREMSEWDRASLVCLYVASALGKPGARLDLDRINPLRIAKKRSNMNRLTDLSKRLPDRLEPEERLRRIEKAMKEYYGEQ